MKVCVFSSPRTRSMLIPNLLERYLGLTNYRETFAYPKRVYEVDYHRLMRLVDNDNYVVKITPSSFHHGTFLRPDIFPWLAFDKIIILNRKNIVEQVASWMVLSYAQTIDPNNILDSTVEALKDVKKIRVPISLLRYSLRCINEFYQINELIQKQGVPTLTLTYEDFDVNYISTFGNFFGVKFTQEHVDSVNVNFTGVDYSEYIQYKQLDLMCKNIIEEDNLSYLKEQINLGNIIC